MEWLDPVYCSGHWVPEMVHLAGGSDPLGREGADSVRIDWRQVLDWAPEVLVLMPCGYDLRKTLDRTAALNAMPHFDELPAVQNGRVYAVDANSYFARPGPRIVEGAELMAHLIHPDGAIDPSVPSEIGKNRAAWPDGTALTLLVPIVVMINNGGF
jgi:iron complex transport system substrate-binding protein